MTQIAVALGETARVPRQQIHAVVQLCGAEQALAWLKQAQELEEQGGVYTHDGKRRRTLGGIFFWVVKDALMRNSQKQTFLQIFRPRSMGPSRPSAQPDTAQPVLPTATWDERGALIMAVDELGEATIVKVTVIGRPGKTIERQNFTLLKMEHTESFRAMPKGLPLPAQPATTQYVVYIAARQWRKVRTALQNPEDVLIVEGVQIWDTTYQTLAVFAKSTTTKLQQQEQRRQQQEAASDEQ